MQLLLCLTIRQVLLEEYLHLTLQESTTSLVGGPGFSVLAVLLTLFSHPPAIAQPP